MKLFHDDNSRLRYLTREEYDRLMEAEGRARLVDLGGGTSKLFFDPALVKKFGGGRFADAFARIEAHYFVSRGFMKPKFAGDASRRFSVRSASGRSSHLRAAALPV